MIVVADTSPVNYLAILGRTEILPILFGSVLIPQAVASELSHIQAPERTREFMAGPPAWLTIRAPQPVFIELVRNSAPKLGAGELEAISLAHEMHASLLLTDERRATREARERFHLRATGLLGVLELAAQRELVNLPMIIGELVQTSFRMPRAEMQRLLDDEKRRRSG